MLGNLPPTQVCVHACHPNWRRRRDRSTSAGRCLSKLPSPILLYQCPLGAANKFQIAHDQRAVLLRSPNFPLITKVISCQQLVLEQVMPTQITLNWATNRLKSFTTAWNAAAHIHKLEQMHENYMADIEELSSPMVLFNQTH